MKMKCIALFLLLIAALLTSVVSFGADKTLKLALYSYPPISYQQDGDWGYCFNLVKAIFEEKGYEVKPKLYPVIRAIAHTEEIKDDAICAINPFSSKKLSFASYSNARLTYYFWVKSDSSFRYSGIESLKGKRVINIKGFNYTLPGKEYQQFLENKANTKSIHELSGDTALGRAFKIIKIGRADSFCLDEPSAMYTLKQNDMVDEFKKSGSLPNVLYGYFGVSENHPQKETLLKIYNEGHVKMHRSKKFAAMLGKFGIEPWPLSEGKR